jgi:hypothetical protein
LSYVLYKIVIQYVNNKMFKNFENEINNVYYNVFNNIGYQSIIIVEFYALNSG